MIVAAEGDDPCQIVAIDCVGAQFQQNQFICQSNLAS